VPNISEELVYEYLGNNIKLSLAQLYSSSKAITKTIKALKDELARIEDVETKGKAV
jgi:biotin operon repressor